MNPLIEQLKALYAEHGYAWFDEGDYNVNLFAFRAPSREAGEFDDCIGAAWKENGHWQLRLMPCTTDPGGPLLERPVNPAGAAIVKAGQYRGVFKVGTFKGYRALLQIRPITVHRDDNRDDTLDLVPDTQTGHFGIFVHRAQSGTITVKVGSWSAGCQVLQSSMDCDELCDIVEAGEQRWGVGTTYTLFEL